RALFSGEGALEYGVRLPTGKFTGGVSRNTVTWCEFQEICTSNPSNLPQTQYTSTGRFLRSDDGSSIRSRRLTGGAGRSGSGSTSCTSRDVVRLPSTFRNFGTGVKRDAVDPAVQFGLFTRPREILSAST